MTEHNQTHIVRKFTTKHRTALIISSASFLIITFLTFGVVKATEIPDGVIAPGVSIFAINVGGLTKQDAHQKIESTLAEFTVPVRAKEQSISLKPFVADTKTYLPIARFDTNTAIEEAMNIGRRGGFLRNVSGRMRARFVGDAVELKPSFDEDIAAAWMRDNFILGPGAAENASYQVTNGLVTVIPEKSGETLLIDDATKKLKRRILASDNDVVTIAIERTTPPVTAAMLDTQINSVNEILKKPTLNLTLKNEKRNLTPTQIIPLLTIQPNQQGLSINPTLAEAALQDWAKPYLNAPVNAEFVEENGRVTKFSPHKDGETIDADALASAITTELFALEGGKKPIEIPLKIVSPEITTEKSNPYGIKETIGIGASNFAGSPRNRRHNINTGAKALNGILVPAGETLSLIGTLGNIDAENGYLPELVIKGNITTPEFGGGLCQIGTTLFRSALNAGLAIPERRNHSYRVSYYERDGDGNYIGPGTDATIYDPSPDLKITNDTGTMMLITTKITGDKVEFIIYGKNDGRIAEKSDVKVFNIVPPPEPKITETTDLPPGVKKCSESPHPGASTVFTYKVTYTDGRPEFTTDFRSYYRPWGEVCLVGVDPNAIPTTDPTVNPTETAPVAADQPIGTADSSGVSGN